jgi:acetylornithine deacetylase/succinyl-diaminopimelate desuccinylase-like protein
MILAARIKENSSRYIQELSAFLKIPSISTDTEYTPQVREAAQWLEKSFTSLNASSVTVHETAGHPIVTAEFCVDALKPTVLVYGHYDVQPAGDLTKWESDPFNPTIHDGKIFARGATDDKGQVFTYLKAIELLQEQGPLPCNIRFLIEGSEEISSKNLPEFLEAHPEITKCDAAVISDTAIIDEDTPSITTGLRGHTRVNVTVKGPVKDVHSGSFGGAITNPMEALCKMIATVTDDKGRVTMPGFYDNIRDYTAEERALINSRDMDAVVKEETGVAALVGEENFTTLERIGIRPAFTALNMHAGPATGILTGVISSNAKAFLAIRTVPGQSPVGVGEMLIKHLKDNAPKGVTVEAEICGKPSSPWTLKSFKDPAYQAAAQSFEQVWGKTPIPEFNGGSIPVVEMLQNSGVSPTLMGFGLESDALHGPNEHMSINRIEKGIETVALFFGNFAEKHAAQKKVTVVPT